MSAARVGDPPDQAAPADPVAAGLQALASEAEADRLRDATDLDVAEATGTPPAPAMSNSQCLMMAGQLVRGTLQSMAKLESPATTMADDKLQPAADALGAVFDKYGINLQGIAGGYLVELTALAVAGPLAWSIYAGIQAEIKAKKKPAADQAGQVEPASAANDEPMFGPHDPRSVRLNG